MALSRWVSVPLLTSLLAGASACGCRREPAGTEPNERGRAPVATVEPPRSSALSPPSSDADPPEARALRERLVKAIADGPRLSEKAWDPRVLDALRRVPRHLFVPGVPLQIAYLDEPLPIGYEQTISQPSVVAVMTDALALTGSETVLEIGTGSGYQAAVASLLARRVFTIEIVAPLGERAARRLAELGYANVEVRVGDGYAGWPEHAPFDRILLTAAPPEVPAALVAQLAEGGILVAPVGEGYDQVLVRWTKRGGSLAKEDLGHVRFVPMVHGDAGAR